MAHAGLKSAIALGHVGSIGDVRDRSA